MNSQIKLTKFLMIAIFIMAILPSILISILLLNDHYHEAKQIELADMNSNLEGLVNEFLHKFNADAVNINLLVTEPSLNEGIKDILITEDAFNHINHFHKLSYFKHSTYLLSHNFDVMENVNGVIKRFQNSPLLAQIKNKITRNSLKKGQQIIVSFHDSLLISKLVDNKKSSGGFAIVAPIFNQALLYDSKMLPTGYLVSIISFQEVISLFNYNNIDTITISDDASTYAVKSPNQDSINKVLEQLQTIKTERTSINFTLKSGLSRNKVLLTLTGFRPSQPLSFYISSFLDSLAIGIILAILFTFIGSIIVVRWINKPFSHFGEIIKSFHKGNYQVSKNVNIKFFELQQMLDLLDTMGSKINKQISKLKKQNDEVSQLAKLKTQYLLEVQNLNLELEDRVNQQTIKISKNLQREEQGKILLQQLGNTAVKLQKSTSIHEVIDLCLLELSQIMPYQKISIHVNPNLNINTEIDLNSNKIDSKIIDFIWSKKPYNKVHGKQCVSIGEQEYCTIYIPNNKEENIACIVVEGNKFCVDTIEIFNLFARQIGARITNIQLYDEVERLARIDPLTNIGNRKAFNDAILRSSKHKQRYKNEHIGLFMIDINGLKPINDKYGHEQGDTLICTLSEFLIENVRDTDQVFRLAGDEFAILLQKGDNQSCQFLSNRLKEKVIDKKVILKQENDIIVKFPLSFSCGYSSTENCPTAQLFADADEKMYHEKEKHYAQMALENT